MIGSMVDTDWMLKKPEKYIYFQLLCYRGHRFTVEAEKVFVMSLSEFMKVKWGFGADVC